MAGSRAFFRISAVALVALFGVAVLTGCGSTNPSAPESDAVAPASGEYLSSPASSLPLVPGTQVQLTLDGSSLSASAGCNSLVGSYSLDGATLVVRDIASTMMGCTEDLMDQDGRLSAFLTGRPVVSTSPDGFTLTGEGDATLVMVERAVADPDRTLESTVWVLNGLIDGEVASSAAGYDGITLLFAGGAATLTSSCSTAATSYTLVPPGTLETATMTVAAFPGSGDCAVINEGVNAVAALFGGTLDATVEAGTLTLMRDGKGATFGAS